MVCFAKTFTNTRSITVGFENATEMQYSEIWKQGESDLPLSQYLDCGR